MDEMAKEIENALKTDFPNAKLAHKPFAGNSGEPDKAAPTMTQQIDAIISGLQSRIRMLEKLRGTL